ncbi:MAG TPA: hypothetical protein VHL10_01980, partial [Nitrososphaera sp.]|nr:hypothetical protein [Nitrososphaera sp.]
MAKTVLMCPPKYFDIEYEINEWMDTSNPVEHKRAAAQWQKLHEIYSQQLGWDVQIIEPVKGLPDMVFTANGGLVLKGKVVLPRFRYPQRQAETGQFKKWFEGAGYYDLFLPAHNFEGEGDAFAWHDMLFAGYPFRSEVKAHREVAGFLGLKPVSIEQINPRFYHLDTALTFINDEAVAIYPGAFSDKSLALIHRLVPKVIEATEEDAMTYGLNAMTDGQNI